MRECGSCTACCDGTLNAEINGHKIGNGKPCRFLKNGGCSIYQSRPEDPCKTFNCLWLVDESIPEFMKPSKSGVILINKAIDKYNYIAAVEVKNKKMDRKILSDVIQYSFHTGQNLVYKLDGLNYWLGNPEFMAFLNKRSQELEPS